MSKEYIGSGKKHDQYNIVKVSIDWEKAQQFIHEYNGKKYLSFDVAEKREVDQYGKTHSVSVFIPDNKEQPTSESQSVNVTNDDDIPF